MTKIELINKYGLIWYEEYKARNRERNNKRYSLDIEFKHHVNDYRKAYYNSNKDYIARRNVQINQRRYVKDGRIDLIENYELAKSDNFIGWHIHHKDEIKLLPSGILVKRSANDLKEINRYYDCPPNELIWLTISEHSKLHRKRG